MSNQLPVSRLLADTGLEATAQGFPQGVATIERAGDSRASAAARSGPNRAEVQREVEAALAEVLGTSLSPDQPLMSGEKRNCVDGQTRDTYR